jgi:cytochrome c oxidase assembly protein subunit 15
VPALADPVAAPRAVRIWLAVVLAMVVAMVALGGVTRLTGSGLSMVEWHPLMGALPPLDEAGWQAVFERYKGSPQYTQVNHWMGLADFKRIFFWEYLHRLAGRLVGVVFGVPWLVFAVRGQLRGRLAVRTLAVFVLGGLQGLLGWFMVKSGLRDLPTVSHYRLAAHLALALLVFGAVLWLLLDAAAAADAEPGDTAEVAAEDTAESEPRSATQARSLARAALATMTVVALQVVYGAFMAGTGAGHIYSTFPTINGRWLPPQAFAYEPAWRNLLESPFGIHFFHRSFGYVTAVVVCAFCWLAWRHARAGHERLATRGLIPLVVVQIALGAITVVWHVPVWSAVLHQLTGVALLGFSVIAVHAFRRRTAA